MKLKLGSGINWKVPLFRLRYKQCHRPSKNSKSHFRFWEHVVTEHRAKCQGEYVATDCSELQWVYSKEGNNTSFKGNSTFEKPTS